MPTYSQRSKSNLAESHKDLQTLFNYVIQYIDCSVICGHRGETEQNKAYGSGHSKLRFPNSKHNKIPAMAVDVIPFPLDWEDERRFKMFGMAVLGMANLLREQGKITSIIQWGGLWEFRDYPHFQIK